MLTGAGFPVLSSSFRLRKAPLTDRVAPALTYRASRPGALVRMGGGGSIVPFRSRGKGGLVAHAKTQEQFEATYNEPMPYKMNPGDPRSCSVCGTSYTATIANTVTCSPVCARKRKTVLQKGRRRTQRGDTFVTDTLVDDDLP